MTAEQESIFDKMRAEISELPIYFREMLIRDEVLQIIDKYKVESENNCLTI